MLFRLYWPVLYHIYCILWKIGGSFLWILHNSVALFNTQAHTCTILTFLRPFQGEDSRDKQDEKENIKKKEVMITFHDVGMNRKWRLLLNECILVLFICIGDPRSWNSKPPYLIVPKQRATRVAIFRNATKAIMSNKIHQTRRLILWQYWLSTPTLKGDFKQILSEKVSAEHASTEFLVVLFLWFCCIVFYRCYVLKASED